MKVDWLLYLFFGLFVAVCPFFVHGTDSQPEVIPTRPGRKVEMKCLKKRQSKDQFIWVYKQDMANREQKLSDGKFETHDSQHEHILILKRAEYSDEGFYILKPLGVGRPVCQKNLQILRAPIAECQSPSQFPVPEGKDVSLICVATSGNPEPTVSWYRVENKNQDNTFLVNTSELIIKSMTRYATGIYRCILRNEEGANSCDIVVRVKFTPEIELYESIIRLPVIRNTTLLCRVTGYPKSRVVWTKGTSITELYSNHLYEIKEDTELKESHYTIYKILTLIAVSLRDKLFGEYWCRVTGYDESYARKAEVIRITDDT